VIPGIPQTIVEQLPLQKLERPIIQGLTLPIFQAPDPSIEYPVINVPTQEEFDAAVNAEKKEKEEEKEEKSRGLPDSKPAIPQIKIPQQSQDGQQVDPGLASNTNLGVPVIEVPIIGEVPVPPKEQVILAGTTATASVAAALAGKSFVEYMVKKFKPVVERIFAQIKKAMSKDLTDYELQLFFAYEHQKKVNKILKKEFKKQKLEQHKKYYS